MAIPFVADNRKGQIGRNSIYLRWKCECVLNFLWSFFIWFAKARAKEKLNKSMHHMLSSCSSIAYKTQTQAKKKQKGPKPKVQNLYNRNITKIRIGIQ